MLNFENPLQGNNKEEQPKIIVPESIDEKRTPEEVEEQIKVREDVAEYMEKTEKEKELKEKERRGEKLTTKEEEFLHEMWRKRQGEEAPGEETPERETREKEVPEKKPEEEQVPESNEEKEKKERAGQLMREIEELIRNTEKESTLTGSEDEKELFRKIEDATLITRENIQKDAYNERSDELKERGVRIWKKKDKEAFIAEKTKEAKKRKRGEYLRQYYVSLGKENEFDSLDDEKIEEEYENRLKSLVDKFTKRGEKEIDVDVVRDLVEALPPERGLKEIEDAANKKKGFWNRLNFSRGESSFSLEEIDNSRKLANYKREEIEKEQALRWERMLGRSREDIRRRVKRKSLDIARKITAEENRDTIIEQITRRSEGDKREQ